MAEQQSSTEKKPATKAQARTTERERDEDRRDDSRDLIAEEWDTRTMGLTPAEKAEQGGAF